jgi:hypothetical protein
VEVVALAGVAWDIYAVYDSPVWGFLALVDLTVLVASLVMLAGVAIRTLRSAKSSGGQGK